MAPSNPDSDFHIRSASSQIPKTYLSKIELGSILFIMWNLHGTSQTFTRGHFLVGSLWRRETFADTRVSLFLNTQGVGCCDDLAALPHRMSLSESVPPAFLT